MLKWFFAAVTGGVFALLGHVGAGLIWANTDITALGAMLVPSAMGILSGLVVYLAGYQQALDDAEMNRRHQEQRAKMLSRLHID